MMRHAWLIVAFVMMATTARGAEKLQHRTWTIDGVKREALLHIPKGAKAHPTPVIFAFHGHMQLHHDFANAFACHTHWPDAIAVYMKGLPKPGDDPKKHGWQYLPDDEGGRDLKFFDAVWASLRKEYKIDNARVYATGFSNGAGFTFLLWAERGERFAAVATCAMKIHRTKILPRLKPKPVMHIAGKADDKVPFEAQVHTVEDFRQLNQCGDGKPWQKECTLYPSKIGDPVVMLVHRHGHELPHEAPPLIVKFFKDHTLDGHGKKGLNSSDTHAENDVRVRGSFPFGT